MIKVYAISKSGLRKKEKPSVAVDGLYMVMYISLFLLMHIQWQDNLLHRHLLSL